MWLRGFTIPGRWCRRCTSELVMAAAPADAGEDALALTQCTSGTEEAGTPTTSWCLAALDPQGLDPHSGHTFRRGTAKGIAYAVSAEGYRDIDHEALVDAVFSSLAFIPPTAPGIR